VSYRQHVVCGVHVGDRVTLRAVDDNPYDPNAVEVRVRSGELAGFVPAALAGRLRVTGASAWDGEVVAVLPGSNAWGLRIRVTPAGSGAKTGGRNPGRRAHGTQSGAPAGNPTQRTDT
jgi:hypothetical protein